jgi:hypothetical protein
VTPEGKAALAATRDRAAYHLDQIVALFTPGKKLTLLVRDPAFPDGSRNFCLTDDTLPEVLEALQIAQTQKDETT